MSYIIYDFLCTGCNHKFESMVLKETSVVSCPECGGKAVSLPVFPNISYTRMGVKPDGCTTAADKWTKMHIKGAQSEE